MIRIKPFRASSKGGAAARHKAELEALKKNLQLAIELEHATIPPYLYALYSIKDGRNLEAAALIRSVVIQEMLHMAIDCNILNAIGGRPKLADPNFIPSYPGHLPGDVQDKLIVGLAPLSKQLLHDVFMMIEEPEHAVDGDPTPDDGVTIGEFYKEIQQQIVQAGKGGNIFTGDPAKQVTTGFAELQHLHICDQKSALAGIELIIRQGEGSSRSPLEPDGELAHYYKYAEIYHGRKLVHNPDPKGEPPWAFLGHPIHFDPCGVEPVIVNPSSASYAGKPELQRLNLNFNTGYSDLLRKLDLVFNGQPDQLGPALLFMQNMKSMAQYMMAQEVVPGQTAGPTFEWIA
ncbi:ferritin-like protein [Massilia sp. W12]|uniref:ferritin-like domain-containing protein n=1 Tax=Massilia sp. W12 TaxID=3126507 RepID=UPI0030CCDB0C